MSIEFMLRGEDECVKRREKDKKKKEKIKPSPRIRGETTFPMCGSLSDL